MPDEPAWPPIVCNVRLPEFLSASGGAGLVNPRRARTVRLLCNSQAGVDTLGTIMVGNRETGKNARIPIHQFANRFLAASGLATASWFIFAA
jgi:hypothetical protein